VAAALAGERGDVDDLAAAVLDHLAGAGLRHEKGTGQVDRDRPVPLLGRDVEEWSVPADPGIVHEDVDPSVTVDNGLHHPVNRDLVSHVHHEGESVGGTERIQGLPSTLFVDVGDDRRRALRDECLGDGKADAACSARHQSDLPL
jgi:hypothetical protein